MDEVVSALRSAADRVESEGGWSQGAPARDADGISVLPSSDTAVAVCASTAVIEAARSSFADADQRAEVVAYLALDALHARVSEPDDEIAMTMSVWEDRLGRTASDVAKRLREVADTYASG